MKSRAAMKDFEYILGDSSREVKRLAFQAKVWEEMTEGLLDRLRVGPGWKVLEVGAGTGTVFLPLARRVKGPGGAAHAVERSPRFAEYLRRKTKSLPHVRIIESEILDAPLAKGAYDLIFARWVFLFLPRIEAHVRTLAAALKPGGLLAIEDYHRQGMAMYPPLTDWADFAKADTAWFASQGGDIDVAGRLPRIFAKTGLETVETTAHVKAVRPGSPGWDWAESYFIGYLDKMSGFAPLNAKKAKRFRREWLAAKRGPGSVLITPTMLDVVGRKKGK